MAGNAAILEELVDRISQRVRLYRGAFTGDLDRLRAAYGADSIDEALRRIERKEHRGAAGPWKPAGHRRTVAIAITNLLKRRRANPDNFDD